MNKLKLLTGRKIMMLVETLNRMPFAKDQNLSGLQVCQVAVAETEYKNAQEKYILAVLL